MNNNISSEILNWQSESIINGHKYNNKFYSVFKLNADHKTIFLTDSWDFRQFFVMSKIWTI